VRKASYTKVSCPTTWKDQPEGPEKAENPDPDKPGNPDEAFAVSAIPNDGCGLARLEFIIGSYIKIHPMALVQPDKVKDEAVRKKIGELTYGYDNKKTTLWISYPRASGPSPPPSTRNR